MPILLAQSYLYVKYLSDLFKSLRTRINKAKDDIPSAILQ